MQQRRKNKTIVLTGGHAATTAIATIEEIKKSESLGDSTLYWIGSKIAREGSNTPTLESKALPEMGVKFLGITAGKIQTKFTRYTITSLLKIPVGFVQSFLLLIKIRPSVTLSFGGYASFPVVFWSYIFRIPVVLHEQTVAAGRATLASAFFASKITLAREDSLKYFPKNKSLVIGNPLTSNVLKIKSKIKIGNPPTILIMGGSRGSNFINELVTEVKDILLERFNLIHITGEEENSMYKSETGYKVFSVVKPSEMAKLYDASDIVISRSGANSVSEIIYAKRPSILIPLPKTFMGEQAKNADYAKDFGIAKVLTEVEATPERIIKEVDLVYKNWNEIIKKVENKNSPDTLASKKLVKVLESYL